MLGALLMEYIMVYHREEFGSSSKSLPFDPAVPLQYISKRIGEQELKYLQVSDHRGLIHISQKRWK